MQDTTRAIRDVRSQHNVAPSRKLAASASASGPVAEALHANADLVCQLAGLDSLEVSEDRAKPNNAATAIVEDAQVYVHDVIDPQAERARLEKQKREIEQALKATEGKLANENFVTRAKPEIVIHEAPRMLTKQFKSGTTTSPASRVSVGGQK